MKRRSFIAKLLAAPVAAIAAMRMPKRWAPNLYDRHLKGWWKDRGVCVWTGKRSSGKTEELCRQIRKRIQEGIDLNCDQMRVYTSLDKAWDDFPKA